MTPHAIRSTVLALAAVPALIGGADRVAASAGASHQQQRAPSSDTLSLEELLDRHVEAMGGRQAMDSLRSLEVRFLVVEPTYALEGRYRATRDGRVRVDVFAGDDNVYSEGIDSAGAWMREGADAPIEPLSAEGTAALRHGIEFNLAGLHRFPRRGHELSYEGRERVEGTKFHVVRAILRDGFEARLYLDPDSWLIARRRDRRALHPDQDSTEQRLETVFHDFEEVCGVRQATRSYQIDLASGDTVQTTRILEQLCNRPPGELDIPRDAEP